MQDLFRDHPAVESAVSPAEAHLIRPNAANAALQGLDNVDILLGSLRTKKKRRRDIAISLYITDLLAIGLGFALSSLIRADAVVMHQLMRPVGVFVPIYFAIALNLNVHNALVISQLGRSIWRAISACATAAMAVILVMFLLNVSPYMSRQVFVVGVVLTMALICLGRLIVARVGSRIMGGSPYANLCIYDQVPMTERSGPGAVDAERLQLHPNLNDIAFVTRLGKLSQGMDKVIIHCRPSRRADWARVLQCLDIDTEIAWPELNSLAPIALRERHGNINLQITTGRLKWHQQVLKRAFDLAFAIPITLLLLPVLALVAIAIRLESKGPVLFVQDRIGLGNRPFKVLKFRSMYTERADHEATKLTERNDSRVTKVGRFIRATSIDELPQFFNVLRGDMSIVGPRPHAPKALAGDSLYWEVDQSYWHRHALKPGITGLAQVRGHRGNTFSEQHLRDRLVADLEYIDKWSLSGDLLIMLRTIFVVQSQDAY